MCGLAGVVAFRSAEDLSDATLLRMGASLRHRGPDGGACWSDEAAGIGLVHRRLAIIDLSDAGLQPMSSSTGQFVLAYNGEIYNHREIRTRLEAEGKIRQPWRGTSDTETLLAAIEAWGVRAALAMAVGMFALALWDRRDRRLWLARDRMGEKPLYYGIQSGALLFGSELKALAAHPAFCAEIDPMAADAMIRLGYVPAPLSIYRDIRKLPAGALLAIDIQDGRLPSCLPEPEQYWSPLESYEAERSRGLLPDDPTTVVELERLLSEAIAGQMVADVPLGAFLSGGIDSTLVTALMQAQRSQRVKTFTIGFTEAEFNEADAARAVARHLGTDHTEFYVTAQDSLDVIPRLPAIFDEPFADVSQIPTQIMCSMARQGVTVALSGDGGDELFGGYNRHIVASRLAGRLMQLPSPVRRMMGAILRALPRDRLTALAASFQSTKRGGIDLRHMTSKLEKVAQVLQAADSSELYRAFVEHATPSSPLTVATSHVQAYGALSRIDTRGDLAQEIMLRDMLGYLPDDVLVKVDRAAMSASLETRAPFLDHRVVAFSHRLPATLKVRDGRGKQILRQILDRHVPRALVERPKMGFGVPIATWLRGPLREWSETLLSEDCLGTTGLLDVRAIRQLWSEHVSGTRNWQIQLWSILALQAWVVEQRAGGSAAAERALLDTRVVHA